MCSNWGANLSCGPQAARLIPWILSFLTAGQINTMHCTTIRSTAAEKSPEGSVFSPVPFTLHRSDCVEYRLMFSLKYQLSFCILKEKQSLPPESIQNHRKGLPLNPNAPILFDIGSSSHRAGGWEELLQRFNWPWALLLRAVMKRSSPNAKKRLFWRKCRLSAFAKVCVTGFLQMSDWISFQVWHPCFETLSETPNC